MKRTLCCASLLVGLIAPQIYAQDNVTLTTYYPSPRGVYQELRVVNNTELANNADASNGVLIIGDVIAQANAGALVTVRRDGQNILMDLESQDAFRSGLRIYKSNTLSWSMEVIAGDVALSNLRFRDSTGADRVQFEQTGAITVTGTDDFMLHLSEQDTNRNFIQFTNNTTGHTQGSDGVILGMDNDESAVFRQFENSALRIENDANNDIIFQTNNIERMRIENDGRVTFGLAGVDQASPALEISGDGAGGVTELRIEHGGDTDAAWEWQVRPTSGGTNGSLTLTGGIAGSEQGDLFIDGNTHMITIGTGPAAFTTTAKVNIMDTSRVLGLSLQTSVGSAMGLGISQDGIQRASFGVAGIAGHWWPSAVANDVVLRTNAGANDLVIVNRGNHAIRFGTNDTEKMTLTADGELHLGRTNVNAHMRIGGTYYCNGADVAEYFSWEEGDPVKPEIGDLVVVDVLRDETLARSQRPYDATVVGVVSASAGMILGSADENGLPVAMVGRVPVNATTENGPIKRGDLLVTSSVPGRAMKGDPSEIGPGMVIGKAMGELLEGEGQIIVLVNLQ